MITQRPLPEESDNPYLQLLPDGDLIEVFVNQKEDMKRLFAGLSDEGAEYQYNAGKWTIKEVLGHLTDTERVMTYRLLCAARGDITPMASFDEEFYVVQGAFQRRKLQDVLSEWLTAREATISLLKSLGPEEIQRHGTFKGRPNTALMAACIIPAHVIHHIKILQERYGLG
ncbi:DinB family protein [Alicyclobacillus sp. SO9]|uniref:DinB family protein n=1 Tax=Alicyclobacillus sp. SO9 TaxID=2665646 RepID=UPI0018E7D9AC|nr:DinB family protein [Alicyclobacillus sp. SO9]QQE78304.1 DinB family protein [Alicyclobacillus sp. SO9]